LNCGSQWLALKTQPPGTSEPTTIAKGTTSSGASIFASSSITALAYCAPRSSIAPALSEGA
jgi:hypothetical protein